jgi:hypothetical protein
MLPPAELPGLNGSACLSMIRRQWPMADLRSGGTKRDLRKIFCDVARA